ncbi:uncharacterized protein LOC121366269 isoform X2 [Gigantopelta aegis]|uniref:uncharacterized protein LOC121366269 isoform X2 n=1 Tax=Gigantopelta aegis TaxID=1735272 RepID=UPI001B88A365|nr:uncharacterized protein LOC121366269 isoform X2 [Gigantopelta aegis]
MHDKIHDYRAACRRNQQFYSPLLRVSARTTYSEFNSERPLKNHAKLFNIFSHPKFDWRNRSEKTYTNLRFHCATHPSDLSAEKVICQADCKKEQNSTNYACTKLFALWKHFNKLSHHATVSDNNHVVSYYSLSWLRKLFLVPKVYASENESVSPKGKNIASSSDDREKISDSSSEAVEEAESVPSKPAISDEDVLNYLSQETGRHRLHVMFSKEDTGGVSPELSFISQVVFQSAAIVFLLMSIIGGRQGRDMFLMQNQPTVFRSRFLAFRKLHDVVFLESIKCGVKWGWKIAMFTFPFLIVSQSIAVYRNKTSPLEYSVAAGVTGSILKLNLGPKGMFAGGVVGAVMGAMVGVLVWAGLKPVHNRCVLFF